VIKILRNIQKDQASQIEEIKNKFPINRKNPNYEYEWLTKTLNEINTGINMQLKNFNDLKTKFRDKCVEEIEEIEDLKNNLSILKKKDLIEPYNFYTETEDFDNDTDITTESTISKRFLDYNTDDGFVIPDNEKNYFCIEHKQYYYSEFHTYNTNIIACNPGDFEIDIIATLNEQIFLIQYKNIVKFLSLQDLQKIESAFKRCSKKIEIIIYNSEKLQKLLTKQAKIW
ncbi:11016_t:CDS:2, partial [Racocetra persica]